MPRDISDRSRRWLSGELEYWQTSGMVSPAQAGQILDCYISPSESSQRKRRLASFVLAALAALLFGLAVLLVIGHNWQWVVAHWEALPRVAKLASIFLLLGGSFGGALYLRLRTAWQRGAEVAFFFACLMYGAGIWHVAQVFHVDAHWPDGLWWWALGTLPVALCLDTLTVHCLLAGLLGFWAGAEVIGWPHMVGWWDAWPNGAYTLLPFFALGLAWCYRKGSVWGISLYVALLSWWIIVQGFSWGDHFWGREEAGLNFVALAAPLLLIFAENHAPGSPAARPWRVLGTLLTAGALIPLSFYDFHKPLGSNVYWPWQPPLQGFGGAMAMIAVLAIVVASLVLWLPRSAADVRRGPLARLGDLALRQWVPLGICLSAVAIAFVDATSCNRATAWVPTVIANVSMVVLAVWLMHVGLRDEQGFSFAGGVLYFLLWSILRYVDLFAEEGGMLGAAGMFFLCGLMLFALSFLWRRRKGLHYAR